ncbi:neugrin [Zootoca vivipara]|uniref:neugrin n=1 Tax=Zootoca vivipara TaxID=8524 RepID=UPI001591F707|nr:neugrin [Zootoca vivipara]
MAGSGRFVGLRRVAARLAAREAEGKLPEEQPEVEQEVERLLQRQEKAIRLRKIQRLMEPRGPPERTLTRQAMEQIRYLRQELPEEWPVSRLARSFQVEPGVILRVLRSSFSPPPERSAKQDAKVAANVASAPESSARPRIVVATEASGHLLPAPGAATALSRPVAPKAARAGPSAPKKKQQQQEEEEDEEGEGRGWRAPSPAELEAMVAEGTWESQLKVVQKGREFFDSDGNFLYRLPQTHQA